LCASGDTPSRAKSLVALNDFIANIFFANRLQHVQLSFQPILTPLYLPTAVSRRALLR
jgi:hypothetical protein